MFEPTLPEKVNHTYFVLPKFGEHPQQGVTPNDGIWWQTSILPILFFPNRAEPPILHLAFS